MRSAQNQSFGMLRNDRKRRLLAVESKSFVQPPVRRPIPFAKTLRSREPFVFWQRVIASSAIRVEIVKRIGQDSGIESWRISVSRNKKLRIAKTSEMVLQVLLERVQVSGQEVFDRRIQDNCRKQELATLDVSLQRWWVQYRVVHRKLGWRWTGMTHAISAACWSTGRWWATMRLSRGRCGCDV